MKKQRTIAFYNLENLFDTIDDPFTDDDDFTPGGKKRWDKRKYENKIRKLGFALSQIGLEETHDAPAIIGLSEVENRSVLKDLVQSEAIKHERFGIIHYDSLDERGIDTALIYQKDQFLPLHTEPIRLQFKNEDGTTDYTRDVLYVNGQFGSELLHIFVLHFPSKRNQDINKPKRIKIAETIRQKVLKIHEEERAPHIIVMGDFNEEPHHKTVKETLQAKSNTIKLLSDEMYNPLDILRREGKGTLVHNKNWYLFDQILFSKAFLYQKSNLRLISSHIFDERFLQDWDERKKGEPFRTFVGRRYQNGYSDHFPVYSILET